MSPYGRRSYWGIATARHGDHEIDFIVERDDHKIVALEVELSSTVEDSDILAP